MTEISILEDRIYEEVLSEEDEVAKAKLLLALTDRAEELKVKTKFITLLNAFKKKYKSQHIEKHPEEQIPGNVAPQPVDRMTEFDGQYTQLCCGGWVANENGVIGFNQLGMPITACYHPILITQRIINIDNGREKVKIAFKKGHKWKEIIVDKEIIASATRIVQLSGIGVSVTSEISKNLVKYLADIENYNLDLIGEQKSSGKLGWVHGEFIPYSKEIIFDNETSFKDARDSIHERGSLKKWMDLIKSIRQSDRLEPKISIVGSLASVLIEPLDALPFILNIYGDTGRGKTVCIMIAASCWANPVEKAYITDPKSTQTAIELRLDFLNSFPMLLDDMSQIKEKCSGDFTQLVYMLCSGKGKERANVSLGLNKPTSWRNAILTNYEYPLVTETMQGGAINRIIDVETQEGYIFENGNQVVEVLKQNYGFAGRIFLDKIREIGIERIRDWQREFYSVIVRKAKELGCEKEEKQILPMSILLTADKIATDYIFEDGIYLNLETCVNLLKNKGEVSENERGYNFIMNEVRIHMNNFVPDANTGQYRGEIWGSIKDGYVNINTNIFNQMAKRGNFPGKSFKVWADKRGLLIHSGNRTTKAIRIDGETTWCVCLKMREDTEEETSGQSELTEDENGFVSTTGMNQEDLPFQ